MSQLEISTHILGPIENNTYVLKDLDSKTAVVVDPSFECWSIIKELKDNSIRLSMIWITHAHFDHIAGVAMLKQAFEQPIPVGLHPADLDLWNHAGGASNFGISMPKLPEPDIKFYPNQKLTLGDLKFSVSHTPGHTRGHVIFYQPETQLALTGDLIFYHSVGRTDLPGGDMQTLLHSIRTQILTLPPTTRLLSGHGPETTVQEEILHNPFLQ